MMNVNILQNKSLESLEKCSNVKQREIANFV